MIVVGRIFDFGGLCMDRVSDVRAHRSRCVVDEVGPGSRLHCIANGEKPHTLGRGCRAGTTANVKDHIANRIAVCAERNAARLWMALESAEGEALRILMHDADSARLRRNDLYIQLRVCVQARRCPKPNQ